MDRDKIIFFRNLLLRAFVIGVGFALLIFAATMLLWDTFAGLMRHLFLVDEKDLGRMLLGFFVNARLIIIFLFLTPALALHWAARKQ
jgi:hypothetical protein